MPIKTRKYLLNQDSPAPSTGKMLEAYIQNNRIYQSALSRLLNRHKSSIAAFRSRATIQTAILWEICHALKHNFFADIAAQLPTEYSVLPQENEQQRESDELIALKEELISVKSERDTLKAMLEMYMRLNGAK